MRKVCLLSIMFVSIVNAMENADSSGGVQPKIVPRPTKEPPNGGEGPDVTPDASVMTGRTASTGSHPVTPETPPTDVIIGQVAIIPDVMIGQVAATPRNFPLNGLETKEAHQAASASEPANPPDIRTQTTIDTETHAPTIVSKESSLDNNGR